MDMLSFCHWLQSLGWAVWIKESFNVFPALYVVHIFGFILLVASTSILDMRMLGLWVRDRSVANVVKLTLPWAKVGFAGNFITGVILFATHAVDMYTNTAFRVKMLMVLAAGLNILLFQITTYRSVEEWGQRGATPSSAKVTAAISLFLWFGIAAMSRVIGFTGAQQ
jgi:hypothetical protein